MLDNQSYNGIWCMAMLCLLLMVIFGVRCIKDRIWLKTKSKRFPVKAERVRLKYKKNLKIFLVLIGVLLIVGCVFITFSIVKKDVYGMTNGYIWNDEERGVSENGEDTSSTFSIVTREYGEKWWKTRINYLFEKAACDELGKFDGIIDKSCIDYYKNKLRPFLANKRVQVDGINDRGKKDSDFEEKKSIFQAAIKNNVLDAATAWKAFKAGQCVQKYKWTSEIVFQVGICAEKAHYRTCNANVTDEMSITYLAGFSEQCEMFLTFEKLIIGEGIEVTETEVLLRLAKCFYNEACYGAQEENIKINCAIIAYVIFSYLADNVEPSNEWYQLCIYYSGHSYLNIMADIQDEEYRMELKEIELRRWDKLRSDDIDYKTEGLSEEIFESVKEQLD